MKHEFKESSVLHSCSYDPTEKELTIVFHNGRAYTYVDVDKSDYEELTGEGSAGKKFAAMKGRLKLK